MTAPKTLAQKLVARAARRPNVVPGEIVTCKVDLAMMHDSGGPRRVKPMLERLGAKVWDPDRDRGRHGPLPARERRRVETHPRHCARLGEGGRA